MAKASRMTGSAAHWSVRAGVLGAALALGLAWPLPGRAQESSEESAEALAAEALNNLLRALDMFMESIPQYEAPIVNENGDIIIRRKRSGDEDAPPPTPEEKPTPPDGTDTTTT